MEDDAGIYTDAELFEIIDEQGVEGIVDANMKARAQALLNTRQRFSHVLFRQSCPAGLTLSEFAGNLLPRELAAEIKAHVAICSHCTGELAAHQAFMEEVGKDIAGPTLLNRVKVFVAELLPQMPQGQLAFGLRGSDEGPLIYEADGVQVSVEVQDDGSRPGYKVVLGLILASEITQWQVQIFSQGKLIESLQVDDFGNFVIVNIESGLYDMIINNAKTHIHINELHIQ